MKRNFALKFAAAILFAVVSFTSVMAAPVRHFLIQGSFTTSTGGSGNIDTQNAIGSALNGLSFSVSLDLDYGTPDSNPDANIGLYSNAVSNTSADAGTFSFSPPANSCVNPALDCFVETRNDQFGIALIDSYLLRTGFVESGALNTQVSSILPGVGTVLIPGVTVGTDVFVSFTFFTSVKALFSNDGLLGPTDFSSLGGNASADFFTTLPDAPNPFKSENGRVNFGLNITRLSEVFDEPASIPEPGTYVMVLAGLGAMGVIARRRRHQGAAA